MRHIRDVVFDGGELSYSKLRGAMLKFAKEIEYIPVRLNNGLYREITECFGMYMRCKVDGWGEFWSGYSEKTVVVMRDYIRNGDGFIEIIEKKVEEV